MERDNDDRMNLNVSPRALLSKILLATDGSTSAKPAEEVACVLANAFEAAVDVVTVLEFEPWRDLEYQVNQLYLEDRRREIREQLSVVAREAEARGVVVARHEPVGVPSQEIVALAANRHSDLVVLGTHGRSGLDHVLIGSTAERVLRTAPCPVMTVKGSTAVKRSGASADQPEGAWNCARILVPMDFSDCSLEAVEYAMRLGERFGSAITLLHVVEPVAYGLDFTLSHALTGTALRVEIGRSMETLAEAFERRGLGVRQEVVPGVPADVIPRVAQERNSDTIVMGTHGRRGWSHVRFGSVTEAVVRQARCPVFAVRSPKFQAPRQDEVGAKREPSTHISP